jgi:LysM repeat protein
MDARPRSPLRFLAPLALIAATLVFLVVIAGAIGGGEDESASTEAAGQVEDGAGRQESGRSDAETYEVQDGDTLDGIAAETGVSVEELQELNPDLDPQSLIAGQELQLSE